MQTTRLQSSDYAKFLHLYTINEYVKAWAEFYNFYQNCNNRHRAIFTMQDDLICHKKNCLTKEKQQQGLKICDTTQTQEIDKDQRQLVNSIK